MDPGTGRTFLYRAILAHIRSRENMNTVATVSASLEDLKLNEGKEIKIKIKEVHPFESQNQVKGKE